MSIWRSMRGIITPTAPDLDADVEKLHRNVEKIKELLVAKERITPDIETLLRQADDAMSRKAWRDAALVFRLVANILKQGGRWDDFDLDDILPGFIQAKK